MVSATPVMRATSSSRVVTALESTARWSSTVGVCQSLWGQRDDRSSGDWHSGAGEAAQNDVDAPEGASTRRHWAADPNMCRRAGWRDPASNTVAREQGRTCQNVKNTAKWSGDISHNSESARRARTEIRQNTFAAPWTASGTSPPTMQDEQQAERAPIGRRDHVIEDIFEFHGVGLGRQPEASRKSPDMRVHWKPGKVHRHAPDHVGSFAATPRDRDEVLHRRRHLAVETLDQGLSHSHQRPGLVPIEAGGPHQFLDILERGYRQILGRRIAGEQRRGHDVDPHIGALRRENGGSEQFVGIAVIEFAVGVGVFEDEPSECLGGSALRRSRSSHRIGTLASERPVA